MNFKLSNVLLTRTNVCKMEHVSIKSTSHKLSYKSQFWFDSHVNEFMIQVVPLTE